ncbi:DUF4283 domain-containing protein/zf-CCHC_4 domain-containing protein [Cephalotus follicularis]|uniref:DUF4283 domain-containing protein/zf-CCHC_4 domain-containing protein n=1 Tax=Cephalotus follicularis TaxID=3775 RepID=A0A1Q3B310_CEPFO|nr:DUF4283 domain-containing protein/zf-CCHC_4 domain-containing protein [Cephalotus follicularis]
MRSLWRAKYGLKIREVGHNLFLFMFNNEEDRDKVLKLGPWHFDNKSFSWRRLRKRHTNPKSSYTRHLCGLGFTDPYLCLSERAGRIIGESIGELEKIEIITGRKETNQYLKLRVGIDVRNPLRKEMKFLVGSKERTWLSFQYEKLPYFFHYCGRSGHTARECEHLNQKQEGVKNEEFQHGAWMSAENLRMGN